MEAIKRKKRELKFKSYSCKKCGKMFQAAKKATYCSTSCRYGAWMEKKIRIEAEKLIQLSKVQN